METTITPPPAPVSNKLPLAVFLAACGRHLIDAGVAFENRNVVAAIRANDHEALERVLSTEF